LYQARTRYIFEAVLHAAAELGDWPWVSEILPLLHPKERSLTNLFPEQRVEVHAAAASSVEFLVRKVEARELRCEDLIELRAKICGVRSLARLQKWAGGYWDWSPTNRALAAVKKKLRAVRKARRSGLPTAGARAWDWVKSVVRA
jgi:hypothetical protein